MSREFDLGAAVLAAFEDIPMAVSVIAAIDGVLTRVYVNRSFARMHGRTADEMLGSAPFSSVVPEDRDRVAAVVSAAGDRAATLECTLQGADGRRTPIEAWISRTRLAGQPVIVSLITDITPRLEMEKALRESEARFRQLAEAAPDTITVIAAGRFVYVNPAAVRVLGFDSREELMARPLDQLLYPEEAALMMDRIRRRRAGVALTPREYVGRRKDGSNTTIEISSIAIHYQGQPAVLAIGRDVSERKRMQAELIRADRMAMIGTLATGVAHEVNNPLTYVLVHLRRLRALVPTLIPQPPDRHRVDQLLSEALDGAERVARIVRDLLSFARPGGDEGQAVDIASVLDSVLLLARSSLDGRARVERDYGEAPPAHADAARLAQVLLNLVLNAVQAFTSDDPSGNVIAASIAASGGEMVDVVIADNGPGISPANLPRVFDPFFTTKPPGSGTGLGLTISRAIVEAFGGELTLRSREGGGAEARVRLRTWPSSLAARRGEG